MSRAESPSEAQRIIVVKEDDEVVVLRVDRVLELASHAKETSLPPLGHELSKQRELFKSMLISHGHAGDERHVLRFDTAALIHMLTTLERRETEREIDV